MDQDEKANMAQQTAVGTAYAAMIKEARKRRARALRLRESGMTVQEVADSLGVTKQRASEILMRAKRETGK